MDSYVLVLLVWEIKQIYSLVKQKIPSYALDMSAVVNNYVTLQSFQFGHVYTHDLRDGLHIIFFLFNF